MSGALGPEALDELFHPALPPYECPFCGRHQPGGFCGRCGEWFDLSQDAVAEAYAHVGHGE